MTPHPKQPRIELSPTEWRKLKEEVFQRDRYCCRFCGRLFFKNMLDAHHIKTRGAGGHDEADNLLTMCRKCHIKIDSGEITKYDVYEAMKQVIKKANLTPDEYDVKIQELTRRLNI